VKKTKILVWETGIDVPFVEEIGLSIYRRFDHGRFGRLYYVMYSLIPAGRECMRASVYKDVPGVRLGNQAIGNASRIQIQHPVVTLLDEHEDILALIRLTIRETTRAGYAAEQMVLLAHHMNGEILGSAPFEKVLQSTSLSERRWRQHMGKKVLETDPIYQLGEELDEEEEAIVIEGEATKMNNQRDEGDEEEFVAGEMAWRAKMFHARESVKPAFDSDRTLPEWVDINDLRDEIYVRAEGMGLDPNDIFEKWEYYIVQVSPIPWLDLNQTPLGPWSELRDHGFFGNLALFALNLLSFPASEASCERSIGQERELLGDSMLSLSASSLLSLMRLARA
jgi:hypothetical protein